MQNNISKNNRIAKNTLFLYLRMGIVLIVALYTTRIVLSNLGVMDYGIYNVVCGFVTMFSFLNATLSSSVNRFYNYEIGKKSFLGVEEVYNNSLRIQGALAVAILIIVEIIGVWYINTQMQIPISRLSTANCIFQFSILSLVFTIFQTPFIAAILAYERMNYYAIVSIIDVILKLFIAFAISFSSTDKLWLYGLLIMLISIVDFFLYYFYSKMKFRNLRFRRSINKRMFRDMLSFTGWSFLNPLAYTSRSQGCNIVLNYYFGPIVNAAYAITNQVASAIDSFSMSVSVAARPQLIQSYSSGDLNRAEKLFYSTSKIMFVLIAMLSLPVIFNIDYILNLWLGGNVPEQTSLFCIFIMAVKLVDSLNPSCSNLILATGNIKSYMLISSFVILSIIPLSILVIPLTNNAVTLFVIMLICTIINQAVSVIVLSKVFAKIELLLYTKNIVIPCLFILIISSMLNYVVLQTMLDSYLRIIILCIAPFIIISILSYFLLFSNNERLILKNMIRNIVKR